MTGFPTRPPTLLSQLLRDLRARWRHARGRTVEPWMKSRELDIIVEALTRLRPARCLEWGAGYSTLYFPARMPWLSSWVAIEHHRDWHAEIAERNHDSRVQVVAIPPDHGEYPNTRKEGTYEDFRSYVDYPVRLGGRFDFVFIDGRARVACLARAFDLVTDEGLVILHDANRPAYVEGVPPFPHQLRLTDFRTNRGGILLASRGRAIEEYLDVEGHRRLWQGHVRLGRALRMR